MAPTRRRWTSPSQDHQMESKNCQDADAEPLTHCPSARKQFATAVALFQATSARFSSFISGRTAAPPGLRGFSERRVEARSCGRAYRKGRQRREIGGELNLAKRRRRQTPERENAVGVRSAFRSASGGPLLADRRHCRTAAFDPEPT